MKIEKALIKLEIRCAINLITKGKDIEEVSVVVKEEEEYILSKIGKSPIVNIRGGVLMGNDLAAMMVMFTFNDENYKYDLWFNCKNNYGKKMIDCLLKQKTILFECIDINAKTVYQFRINNCLSKLANSYIAISGEYITWEDTDFYNFVDEMYDENQYNMDSIWDRLLL